MRGKQHDEAWYREVRVLWRRPLEFFPTRDHTPAERLNSLVRFVTYASLGVYAYNRRPKTLVLALAAVALLSVAFWMRPADPAPRFRAVGDDDGTNDRLNRLADAAADASTTGAAAGSTNAANATSGPPLMTARVKARAEAAKRAAGAGGGECTWSSRTNPFANVLLTDYADDPERPPACDYDAMKHDVRRNFNRGLIRSTLDVYERENSQRQFYTTPVTTTYPDTKSFAEFVYGTKVGCKENTAKCTGYV
jgi:hypothetical protein